MHKIFSYSHILYNFLQFFLNLRNPDYLFMLCKSSRVRHGENVVLLYDSGQNHSSLSWMELRIQRKTEELWNDDPITV